METESQEVSVVESKFIFSPEVFDPNKKTLEAIKAKVSEVTADPKTITKEELVLISSTRKDLMKARTGIKEIGKREREVSNKYSKDVIAYEKELIEIIEPEEKRLKAIEDDAKTYALREARREELPAMKEKLTSISGEMPKVTDEELLDMDTTQFQELYNDCKEEWLITVEQKQEAEQEARQAELDAKEKALQDEKDSIEREKQKAIEIKEAELRAKQEAEEKAKQEADEKEEKRLTNEAKEKADTEAKEKAELEAKLKQESEEKYKNWLAQFNYTPETHHLITDERNVTTIYRKIENGEYYHNQ
ncbi:MAG: hypothetical protein V3V41_01995 [Candidatus Heimdallarchaeota archaeon]